jgi:TonB-dependent starch-binding outer membrane protein SusC
MHRFLSIKPMLGLILLICIAQLSFAQNRTITGKVTDASDGSPMPGVIVRVKEVKNVGTSTAADGTYSLEVPADAKTLIFSFVGYNTLEIPITGSVVNAKLESGQALNEVVVIGYGTQRKRDLTGAVTAVLAKDFNKGVVVEPQQLLQGKVAGLQVTNSSGQPGASTTVEIRGNNSIRSGDDPLYVVDGVPLDGRTPRPSINLGLNGNGLGQTPSSDPLIYINPNDIASIEVLKDASATAIYGSRGANGVILITTKTGQAGPPKVDANASVGVSGIMKRIKVLTPAQYRAAQTFYGVNNSDSGSNVNALNAILRNALTQNYSLAFSGGNENGKYRASFLASDQQGIIKKSGLTKYVANLSGQYNFFNKKLSVNFNLTTSQFTENLVPITNTAGSTGNLIADALNWNPTMPLQNSDGTFKLIGATGYNPLALLTAYDDVDKVSTVLGNINATYNFTKWLSYKFLYGLNYGTAVRAINIAGWYNEPGISGVGQAFLATGALSSQTFTNTLNFDKQVSKSFHINAVIGTEYWTTAYGGSNITAFGFQTNLTQQSKISVPYTNILQSAPQANTSISSYADPSVELQSYFARAIFNYQDKFLLTGTIRADGSSKFGKNNRFGYFPAVAAKWNISNERFLQGSTKITNLDLRIGWGITGNQEFPAGAAQDQYYINSSAIQLTNVANPNLKWEQDKQTDIGLDFALFKNRINGTVDYFNKNTTNVLFQLTAIQPAPSTQYFINLPGNLINKGVEISLGGTIIQNKNWTWEVDVNGTFLKNLFTNYSGPLLLTGAIDGQGVSNTFGEAIANNEPVDVFYLKQFSGFDTSGASIIATNPSFAGNPNPSFLLGISTSLSYKKLSLVVNMHGAYGFLIYNNTETSVTNLGVLATGKNVGTFNLGTKQSITDGVAASTRYLESGDYLKLGNAALSYDIGDIGKNIKDAHVYLSGTNLFEITKFQGFDAEVNVDKNNNGVPSMSMEYVPYPTARTFTLGVSFSL